VNFLGNKEMDAAHGADGGSVKPTSLVGNKIEMQVDIRSSLRGKDLRGTVAHEGTHVSDLRALADSYNPITNKYSAERNLTIFQLEMHAYTVGDRIIHHFSSTRDMEDHIRSNYDKIDKRWVSVGKTE
jgi:hypothetical protein